MSRQFLQPEDVATATGRNVVTIRRDCAAGRIPSVMIGRRRLIPASFLDDLAAAAYASTRPSADTGSAVDAVARARAAARRGGASR